MKTSQVIDHSCEHCKHWEKLTDPQAIEYYGSWFGGCYNPKMIYEQNLGQIEIYTAKNYGCIHWEPKS